MYFIIIFIISIVITSSSSIIIIIISSSSSKSSSIIIRNMHSLLNIKFYNQQLSHKYFSVFPCLKALFY